jgi:hypothetical protein
MDFFIMSFHLGFLVGGKGAWKEFIAIKAADYFFPLSQFFILVANLIPAYIRVRKSF